MSLTLPTLKKSKTHIRIRKKCPTLPTPREIILSTPKEVVFDTSFRSAIIRAEQIQNGGRRGQKSAYRPVLGCYWRKRGASTVLFGVFWLAIERKLSLRWLVLLEQFFCPAKKAFKTIAIHLCCSYLTGRCLVWDSLIVAVLYYFYFDFLQFWVVKFPGTSHLCCLDGTACYSKGQVLTKGNWN